MTLNNKNNLSFYTFPVFDALNIKHGIFMRSGGCSPKPWDSLNLATSVGDTRENVIENRRRITETLSLKTNSIYDVWQVHSNKVITTDKPRSLDTPHIQADAIITNNPGVTLMMLFADCVPILFYDPVNFVSAIAHAGWQGTVNGIVPETIKEMQKVFQSDPKQIIACIGPSICVDHYEIGSEVEEAIKYSFEETDQILINKSGRLLLDLQTANKIMLQGKGIKNIFISDICTADATDEWFSHRAENGKTGRFAAVMTTATRGGE